jgi:hypothetical protein
MKKWLDCTISPGQFTGEFAVQGKLFDGTGFSLFAESSDLKFIGEPTFDKPVEGFIRVMQLDKKEDLFLVSLPHSTLENGQAITVKADMLREKI